MSTRKRPYTDLVTVLLDAVAFIAIAVIGFYFLPRHALAGTLYAIPILIAAHRSSRRTVGMTAAVSLVLFAFDVWVKSIPASTWLYTALGLIFVAYLGTSLAHQTSLASTRAAEAEDARLRLRNFVSMVAHDLRGPLAVILGYSQLLGKDCAETDSKVETGFRRVEAEARRMNRLIQDILDASQLEAGGFKVQCQRMDLVELAQHVVGQEQATDARHQLVLDAPPKLEGEWDPDRIAQVLTNLVNNAIKYSPDGGEVRVHVRPQDHHVTVSIIDQGVGFASDQARLLFEPFSRLHQELSVKGTGLGLYISKEIVEAHGGRIWAESRGHDKGSIFSFTLPLAQPHPQSEGHGD